MMRLHLRVPSIGPIATDVWMDDATMQPCGVRHKGDFFLWANRSKIFNYIIVEPSPVHGQEVPAYFWTQGDGPTISECIAKMETVQATYGRPLPPF